MKGCPDDLMFELVHLKYNNKTLLFFVSVLPGVCTNSFSIIVRAIDYILLLVFLQYPRNDRLSDNTDATIIHHSSPKCVKPLYVDRRICL